MHDVGNTIVDAWRAFKEFLSFTSQANYTYGLWAGILDVGAHNSDHARASMMSFGDAMGVVMVGIAGFVGMVVGAFNTLLEAERAMASGLNALASASNSLLGTSFGMIDLSQFNAINVSSAIENTRSSSGNFGGSDYGSGSSDTGGTGGIGGTGGSGTGGTKHHPPKKPPTGSTGPGGNVAPPGSSGYGSGIGTGGTGSANNILIVIEIDGQVFASQVVQQVYDQVRLRLGPGGITNA